MSFTIRDLSRNLDNYGYKEVGIHQKQIPDNWLKFCIKDQEKKLFHRIAE
jgi:hypothetical protein